MTEIAERLILGGENAIDALIAKQASETLEFECKSKSDPSSPKCNNDDKKNLGKALSGFANSMGGTLVFGIDARPIEGIDCVTEKKPISEVAVFAEEIKSLAGQLVMPRLDGVTVRIFGVDSAGRGYVALTVPHSERRPHRSEVSGDKTYYRRSGTSFHAMEHFEIEDAFKRNSVASLELQHTLMSGSITQNNSLKTFSFKVVLSLQNASRTTAKFPYLFVGDVAGGERDSYGLDGNGNHGLRRLTGKEPGKFGGGADDVIHPGMVLAVTQVKLSRSEAQLMRDDNTEVVCQFQCDFGSEHAAMQSTEISITAGELRQIRGK